MSASPLPVLPVQAEWTLYTTLELALPAAAILAAALIAWYGWHHALRAALIGQAAASRLAREERAHDQLIALLDGYLEWFVKARVTLHSAWADLVIAADDPSWGGPESQRYMEARVAELADVAKAFDGPSFWIRDATLVFPVTEPVVTYLELLGGFVDAHWGYVQRAVQARRTEPERMRLEAEALALDIRCMGMISGFCSELRALIVHSLLTKQYEHGSPRGVSLPEHSHWLAIEDGRWVFRKRPPVLLSARLPTQVADLRSAFSEELEGNRYAF